MEDRTSPRPWTSREYFMQQSLSLAWNAGLETLGKGERSEVREEETVESGIMAKSI